jgi:hypothetical protein
MQTQTITNQFKHLTGEVERRKLFVERMERKLAIKNAMLQARRLYTFGGRVPSKAKEPSVTYVDMPW